MNYPCHGVVGPPCGHCRHDKKQCSAFIVEGESVRLVGWLRPDWIATDTVPKTRARRGAARGGSPVTKPAKGKGVAKSAKATGGPKARKLTRVASPPIVVPESPKAGPSGSRPLPLFLESPASDGDVEGPQASASPEPTGECVGPVDLTTY
jgi:hypothetical protein